MATNPYTVTAPTPNAGLLSDAMGNTPQVASAAPAPAPAATYNPAQASTANATATDWNVAKNQTVQGQLGTILDSGSPLLQQAETNAAQAANRKGLLNSSMAVSAGQQALINTALPIAQQDASTFASAGQTNANTANTTSQFNASAQNQGSQFNTASQNEAGQFNANSQNTMGLEQAKMAQTDRLTNQAAVQQTLMKTMDQQFTASQATADNATKLQLQTMQSNTQKQLADIEANYKTLMQTNASAGEMYQQTLKNITDLVANKDLDAAAKNAAIAQQSTLLANGLALMGKMTNMDLGNLLDFTNVGAALPPAAPAPAPAPVQGQAPEDVWYGDGS